MLLRGKIARKYWKALMYLLLITAIAFYISKNDQSLVKNREAAIKTFAIYKKNNRRTTNHDVKQETRSVSVLNLTNLQREVTKKKLPKLLIRNLTIRNHFELELSDKFIDDYFKDKNFSIFPSSSKPEVRHIAFLKVHKAASSTMQNMFFRFGRKRNLTFVFTKHPNYFSRSISSHIPLVPPKVGQGYDILCNHGVFNHSTYSSLLPNDTVYIGIVRDPLSVFISAVNFYSQESQKLGYLTRIRGQKLQKLIHKPEVYDRSFFSYTKNVMARDFGFPQTFDNSIIFQTLKELDKIFTLVLIVEHFEESLVLMRRYLNWKLQDILFLPNNVFVSRVKNTPDLPRTKVITGLNQARANPWYGQRGMLRDPYRGKPVSKSDLSRRDVDQFKMRNKMDYYVHSFFTKKFWKQFKSAPSNIEQEVTCFKQVLERLALFCNQTDIGGNVKPLIVQKSQWNAEFTVSADECVYMKMDELKFIKILRHKQGSELREANHFRYPPNQFRLSVDDYRKMSPQQRRMYQQQIIMGNNKPNEVGHIQMVDRGYGRGIYSRKGIVKRPK